MKTGPLFLSRRNALLGLTGSALAAPALITSAFADNHAATDYTTPTITISQFSLDISNMAIQKATVPAVTEFARLEKGEQTAVSYVIESTGVTPPPRPPELEKTYQELLAAKDEEFDKLYIKTEISGHEKLLTYQEPESHKKPVDVDVATASILVAFIDTHLTMLHAIQKQIG